MTKRTKYAVIDEFGKDISTIVQIIYNLDGFIVLDEFGKNISSIVEIKRIDD